MNTSPASVPRPVERSDRVAVHGVGAMGGAIVAGLVKAGMARQVVAVETDGERAGALIERYASSGVCVLTGAEAPSRAGQLAGTHLIVVKPPVVAEVLNALAPLLAPGDVVASLALGVTTSFVSERLPAGVGVLRVMPNTPALVGAGMSAVSRGSSASAAQADRISRLLASVGEVVEVPEAQQDAVTAVSGSGPAYLFAFVEAMIAAGMSQGLEPEVARKLAVQTAYGAGLLLHEPGADPAQLRVRVTSPGGSTAAALEVLRRRDLDAVVEAAMLACAKRSAAGLG